MALFDRVFSGAGELYERAVRDTDSLIEELGGDAPVPMPDTAYYLACIYAYLGKKVTKLSEMKEALSEIKGKMTRKYRTGDIFANGIAAVMALKPDAPCPDAEWVVDILRRKPE